MKKLISLQDAQKLVSGSEERKDELISKMNAEIESQAEKGLRWSHLPNGVSQGEATWLKEELVLNGFTVKDGNPAVTW